MKLHSWLYGEKYQQDIETVFCVIGVLLTVPNDNSIYDPKYTISGVSSCPGVRIVVFLASRLYNIDFSGMARV